MAIPVQRLLETFSKAATKRRSWDLCCWCRFICRRSPVEWYDRENLYREWSPFYHTRSGLWHKNRCLVAGFVIWSKPIRHKIDLQDTNKLRCFPMTKFRDCFIIRSWSWIGHCQKNQTLTFQGSDLCLISESVDLSTQEKTVFCRQLFAGYGLGYPMM